MCEGEELLAVPYGVCIVEYGGMNLSRCSLCFLCTGIGYPEIQVILALVVGWSVTADSSCRSVES